MNIEKIGSIQKLFKIGHTNQQKNINPSDQNFQVSLSQEAKKQAEIAKFTEIIKNTPDVRIDKVNEVKRKIQSGNYFSNFSKELLATKLIENLFIQEK